MADLRRISAAMKTKDDAFFKRLGARIAADLLPVLAETLELSLDEMLIGEPAARPAGKRGPASRLQQQIDAIGQLPKAKQKFVVEMIDTVLAQHAL